MTTADRFLDDALANPINVAILERLPDLGLAQPWLVAGCLYQAVWNRLSDKPAGWGIKDYDVFYWDEDTSWEAEDAAIKRADILFADLGAEVELKNQKRVPLWFEAHFGAPYPPVSKASDGIERFLVACTCVGLTPTGDGAPELLAPYGLDDLYAGVLKINPHNPSPHRYAEKCASYLDRWPWLTFTDL
ncbi:MAG: nucleotidyltransferase family protein [Alphaproteobacteria bacterium]|nr:nucleotidyltransferase family protein [Alphaproteobacteria bacterium]